MSKDMSDVKTVSEKAVLKHSQALGVPADDLRRAYESEGYRIIRQWLPTSAESCDSDTFEPYLGITLGEAVERLTARQIARSFAARQGIAKNLGSGQPEARQDHAVRSCRDSSEEGA